LRQLGQLAFCIAKAYAQILRKGLPLMSGESTEPFCHTGTRIRFHQLSLRSNELGGQIIQAVGFDIETVINADNAVFLLILRQTRLGSFHIVTQLL
jgi:hypothetical protein